MGSTLVVDEDKMDRVDGSNHYEKSGEGDIKPTTSLSEPIDSNRDI